jgi:hypothetical protein
VLLQRAYGAHQVEAEQQRAKRRDEENVDKVPREALEKRLRAHGDVVRRVRCGGIGGGVVVVVVRMASRAECVYATMETRHVIVTTQAERNASLLEADARQSRAVSVVTSS